MTWHDVRAGILLLVVGVNGVVALPLARKANRADLDRPGARDEIARWSGLLSTVGIDASHEQLANLSYQWANLGVTVRGALTSPFKPLYHVTGTGQNWALFTYPDRWPARLVIEAKRGEEWVRLYASLDPDHTFREEAMVYRRTRGVYDGQSEKPGKTWDRFCSWAAAEVFAAYPEVNEVRVKFIRIRTYEPGEAATTLEEEGDRFARLRTRP